MVKPPKVLVYTLTSDRHSYVQELTMMAAIRMDYPNFNYLVIETSKDEKNYDYLKEKGWNIVRQDWIEGSMDRVVAGRNVARQEAIDKEYDYVFGIDSDTILPRYALKKMINDEKDCIGYLNSMGKYLTFPCVFKSGTCFTDRPYTGLDLYDWQEIYALMPSVIKCHGATHGLIKTDVLREIKWETLPNLVGEDILFYNNCEEKGFDWYCDLGVFAKHYSIPWDAKGVWGKIK